MKHSPRTAKTLDAICSLRTDGCHTKDHWICIDARTVSIVSQKPGEAATGEVILPRATFDKFVRWYNRPTKHP
jgi:hypothetical protein